MTDRIIKVRNDQWLAAALILFFLDTVKSIMITKVSIGTFDSSFAWFMMYFMIAATNLIIGKGTKDFIQTFSMGVRYALTIDEGAKK